MNRAEQLPYDGYYGKEEKNVMYIQRERERGEGKGDSTHFEALSYLLVIMIIEMQLLLPPRSSPFPSPLPQRDFFRKLSVYHNCNISYQLAVYQLHLLGCSQQTTPHLLRLQGKLTARRVTLAEEVSRKSEVNRCQSGFERAYNSRDGLLNNLECVSARSMRTNAVNRGGALESAR